MSLLARDSVALEGTFIRLTGDNTTDPDVAFQDPSVRDFLLGYLARNPSELGRVLDSATLFVQVERIREFAGDSNRGLVWGVSRHGHAPLASALKSNQTRCLEAMKRTAITDDSEDGSTYAPSYEERLLITLVEMDRLDRQDDEWVRNACAFIAARWSNGVYDLDGLRELARNVLLTPAEVQEWFAGQMSRLKDELIATIDSGI